jgi:hypothetical protein
MVPVWPLSKRPGPAADDPMLKRDQSDEDANDLVRQLRGSSPIIID